MAPLSRGFDLITLSNRSPITPTRHAASVWALPFSLATTQGITVVFFSAPYLDVSVQEVGSLSSAASSMRRVVPFGDLRIYRSCAAPRSFSQLTTSFFASQTLGIHHTPLFRFKTFLPSWRFACRHDTCFDFAFPICQRTLFNSTRSQ